jgi:hypothetical protein
VSVIKNKYMIELNLDNQLKRYGFFQTTNPRYQHKMIGNGWILNVVKLDGDKCQVHASHMSQVKPTLNNPLAIRRGEADHRPLGRKISGVIPNRNYVRLVEAHEIPNRFVIAMAQALQMRLNPAGQSK